MVSTVPPPEVPNWHVNYALLLWGVWVSKVRTFDDYAQARRFADNVERGEYATRRYASVSGPHYQRLPNA